MPRVYLLPQHVCENRSNSSRGFALVIALSLMAFILLLVLSLTTLTQVEIRSAEINLNALKARENARLALSMAIAQLQKEAGHDQRVTARADILGKTSTTPATRFWTGVWDTTDMEKNPVWLVSGKAVTPESLPANAVRLVGPGTVGEDASQYVYAPGVELLNAEGNVSGRLAWWIGDEGVKASAASLPLNKRPTPNFLTHATRDSLQLQLATTHGLEALFAGYDRFSSQQADLLDQVHSISQIADILGSNEHDLTDNLEDALFHTLTLNSYGVLSSTAGEGLMEDLSLFPGLLGEGLRNYLQLGEAHADLLARQPTLAAKKFLFTDIRGLEDIGSLDDGDIATPIIPVLSNFMIAFTIRAKKGATPNEPFLLRARFFCEFWNPFTHTLNMLDSEGNPINLELEITGFPKVTVHGTSQTSNPVDLQTVMGDPEKDDNAVVIRLINNREDIWLPGKSKNWVGLENTSDPTHSPYESVVTQSKQWHYNDNTLGGIESKGEAGGIDTGEPHFTGTIHHESADKHTLRIKVYKVTSQTRELVSDLNGFSYEPVDTHSHKADAAHAGMTFGYHVILREPHHSNLVDTFFRGRWLKEHDPRSPVPLFRDDWYLNNTQTTGSPYLSVINGSSPIALPEPQRINQTENTIDTDRFERLLDRSIGKSRAFNKLWQDVPLFELPRRRVLSLASLQHLYMHNERPLQVGNSWGSQGRHNTSRWFDRYYFSGFSQKDHVNDLNQQTRPGSPVLKFINTDGFLARFPTWKKATHQNTTAAREPALHFMVDNRFNINSTSVDAWKAVLSSLRMNNFSYLDYPENDTSKLKYLQLNQASRKEGSFTRFSHSLEESYEAPVTPLFERSKPPTPIAPSAFYRLGARRFSAEQFEQFAQEIVRLITLRGAPFKSMQEFLSALPSKSGSLLEQAIENIFTDPITKRQMWRHRWETKGILIEDEAPIEIDHFSPGFLTQADIMTAIGPMLAPRSDTFKIRARGEHFSKVGEPVSSATLEAVVQRTPEPSHPNTLLKTPTHRKWKLVDINWLKDDEL